MERTELVVYDLDGVITRKDTFTALVIGRLVRSPSRFLRALPACLTFLSGRKAQASRRIAEIALSGMSDDDYSTLAERLGQKFGADSRWMRSDAVERVRRQHAYGSRIVIATATEHRLASALLATAEIPFDELSASRLEVTTAGPKVADHRVGARKADALRSLGIPLERVEFVTDSLTDLPTARAAARVVLMGASAHTRRRFDKHGIRVSRTS
ncbi:haloacid dehalogenase-like hydrolase [Brevibacterium sp. FAM 24630]|nr:haloacid dehalogenase-like hydrolase [Brevibacterium sp. S111]